MDEPTFDHNNENKVMNGELPGEHSENRLNEQPEALQASLAELKTQLAEEKNRHLRTRADFDNFRKRVNREMEAGNLAVKKEILSDLLTFLDYFEQAKKQVQDPAAVEGLTIMTRQLKDLLQRHGVRPIVCLGLPYDPEYQEGIGFVTTADYPEGCVAEEVSTGYLLDDQLLKPARVMVEKKS